jgi:uncharacterized membrane protein YeaQ/YmgE (transglycosylase-associated protein family)
MNLIVLIVVGAVIGLVARFLMPGRDPIGFVGTILLGIVGVLLGGWAWDALAPNNDSGTYPVIAGTITAMVLLFIYRKVTYGRHNTSHVAR